MTDINSWIGQHIGNYRLVRLVGEGGMGMVFEAVHDGVGGRAAIKILRPDISARADLTARFFNEARAANAIQHPGIVRIFDSGYTPERVAFLTMEFLDGESLNDRLQRETRLPIADALRIGRQLASALVATHKTGIIHRDLKPDNIMLVADPELPSGERVKVLDFGIAKVSESLAALPSATANNLVMGTPAYMSPEQCKGMKQVTDRADVYSLGVIVYQMIAGRTPFMAEAMGALLIMQVMEPPPPLESLVSGVDSPVVELVNSMLAKDATHRPAMDEIVARLQAAERALAARPSAVSQEPEPTEQLTMLQLRQAARPVTPPPRTELASDSVVVSEVAPEPKLHASTVTDAASEASPVQRLAGLPKRSLILAVGAGVAAILTLVLGARLISRPAPKPALSRPIDPTTPLLPKPPHDEPPVVTETPPDAGKDLAPELALPHTKVADPHYAAARRQLDGKRYPAAIKESEKCGHDAQFQCSVVRAKAACHTTNRAAVQVILDSIKESKRADKDKAVQEIRSECESDSLDYAEKLLGEKQYQRAQTVARGNQTLHPDRAWELIGKAVCAMDDRPAIAQAFAKLQASSAHREAMWAYCAARGVHLP